MQNIVLDVNSMDAKLNEKSFLEKFVSIFGIGVIECVKSGLINVNETWCWLFNYNNMKELKKLKCDKKITYAIDLGTELDAVAKAIPDKLEASIDDIKQLFIDTIRKHSKLAPSELGNVLIFECDK